MAETVLFIQGLIGITLLLAGSSKIVAVKRFQTDLRAYGMLPTWSLWLISRSIAGCEIATALPLLFAARPF